MCVYFSGNLVFKKSLPHGCKSRGEPLPLRTKKAHRPSSAVGFLFLEVHNVLPSPILLMVAAVFIPLVPPIPQGACELATYMHLFLLP